MGRGIALQIKREYPAAYQADLKTPKGSAAKLGTCSVAKVKGPSGDFIIVNAYTQVHWTGRGRLADYDAIRSCMRWIASEFSGSRIGLPKIGAGLAGGDWNTILKIIEEELSGEDVKIVEFVPPNRSSTEL